MIKRKIALVTIGLILIHLNGFAQNELKPYTDSLGFYSFNYPENFELKKMGPAAVQVITPLSSADDKFREILSIQLSTAPENLSIDSLASLLGRNMQVSNLLGVRDFQKEKIQIDNCEGYKISMTTVDTELVSISESFALKKGIIIRLSYRNEFQLSSSDIVSFGGLIGSLKLLW